MLDLYAAAQLACKGVGHAAQTMTQVNVPLHMVDVDFTRHLFHIMVTTFDADALTVKPTLHAWNRSTTHADTSHKDMKSFAYQLTSGLRKKHHHHIFLRRLHNAINPHPLGDATISHS